MKKLLFIFIIILLTSCNDTIPNKVGQVEITFDNGSKDTIIVEYLNSLYIYEGELRSSSMGTFAKGINRFSILSTKNLK